MGRNWTFTTAPFTLDYSRGFGGRYGIEKDRRDKAALGYDYKGETEKHESQRGKLGLKRRENTEWPRTLLLSFLEADTEDTEGQMCSGSGEVKSKCVCWGSVWRDQEGWRGKQQHQEQD